MSVLIGFGLAIIFYWAITTFAKRITLSPNLYPFSTSSITFPFWFSSAAGMWVMASIISASKVVPILSKAVNPLLWVMFFNLWEISWIPSLTATMSVTVSFALIALSKSSTTGKIALKTSSAAVLIISDFSFTVRFL